MSNYEFLDGWTLRESAYAPDEETSRATVFALANGVMGLRGAGEELSPTIPGAKGCYLNGIYDTPNGKLTEREFPNVQDWTLVELEIDGEKLDLSTGRLLEYRRELDMRRAIMTRRIRWESPGGSVVQIESERFLSMVRPQIGLLRFRATVEQASRVVLKSGISAHVNNRWADHFKAFRKERERDLLHLQTETFDPGYAIDCVVFEEVSSPQQWTVAHEDPTESSIEDVFRVKLEAGEHIQLTKWCALRESRFSSGDLRRRNIADLEEATDVGYEGILNEHADRWAELWTSADVAIQGDDEALLGIRFSLFHLLAAAPYQNDLVSIPARGLQGQDYYGSIFWDCEIFVFPLFAYTLPQAARNILGYRLATLDGARRKAARFGYRGAFFAWQSQETGDDQCDLYVFTNPLTGEKIRSYFCDEQIHISSDILHAAWQYYQATGDERFWLEGGAELAVEVARFFVSRSTWIESKGRFEIHSVLGPDEYHENVDNNAFTNAFARESALVACRVLDLLRGQFADDYARLRARLSLTDEEEAGLATYADRVYVPAPDPQTKLIEQFDGYFALKDEPIPETNARLAHPDLHKGGPLGPFQETQNIKQADVVMLLYLLRHQYDQATKRANWEYYEPRTAHDSSLSPMAYSLVAADIGMRDWAAKYYLYTSHIDLESYGPHWNLGVHTASLGGAWLAIVHGFCRLRLTLDAVVVDQWPMLPASWKRVELSFVWHGVPMRLSAEPSTLELRSLGDRSVPVRLPDRTTVLEPGGRLSLNLPTL